MPKKKASRAYSEEEAIDALQALADRWPQTLWLYSASGTLTVMRKVQGRRRAPYHEDIVTTINGIENDGGDW